MDIDSYDYHLPAELIAQTPIAERTASRLLCALPNGLHHRHFEDLPELLNAGDLLVLNDTRVVKARLFGRKPTGGQAELLLERQLSDSEALFQVRVSKPIKTDGQLQVGDARLRCLGREGPFYHLRSESMPLLELLEAHGEVPLPPYIERQDEADEARYQTVYAQHAGAVAAPTAGLHFDEALLARLREQGVRQASITLHVGAGTFQPVRGAIEQHVMHAERYRVDESVTEAILATQAQGGRVVAVGTTVVRALESMYQQVGGIAPANGETRLFITPGFNFNVVDALITNFHLPKSTLLMLVAAFAGYEPMREAYAEAVAQGYRFFSYGDAMWLQRAAPASTEEDAHV